MKPLLTAILIGVGFMVGCYIGAVLCLYWVTR